MANGQLSAIATCGWAELQRIIDAIKTARLLRVTLTH